MSKAIRFLTVMLALFISWQVSFAQTRTITGTVKDNKGEAIVGASVIVKGTTTGTYTDVDGNYSIAVPANSNILVFKYLGYKNSEMAIGANNVVNAALEEDVLGLDEVVVTALGISTQKRALGYATQNVSGADVSKTPQGNALSELAGKVSGLTVIQSTGTPGGGTYVRLRGVTSLTGNNQPLIVVDGIPIDNSINSYDPTNALFQASNANGNAVGGVNPTNRGVDVNPEDIASITVLKGPAATALYGINAASGALIITTKKGDGGKNSPKITFNSSFSLDYANKLPGLQNTYGQGSDGQYYGPLSGSGNRRTAWGPKIDTLKWTGVPNDVDVHGDIVGQSDPTGKIPVTPYDANDFYTTGRSLNNNIAFSGGNDKSGFRFSLGNVHQNGIIPKSALDKTTATLSAQTSINSKLSASGAISYIKSDADKVQSGSNISSIGLGNWRTPPTFDNANGLLDPVNNESSYVFPDGTERNYRGGIGYDNPYWSVNRNPYHEDVNRVYGFGQIDYKVWNWLSLTYRLGGDVYSQKDKNSYDIQSTAFPAGVVILDDYFNRQFNSDLIATLQGTLAKNLTGQLILGQNFFSSYLNHDFTRGDGLSLPTFFDISNATSVTSRELDGGKKTMAWYGEGQLQWKDQLFLTVTGRDETSSTLPSDHNNFFYPSASLGWVFTETFGLSNNKVFPYGKLRLSAAQVGKDAPIQALQTYFVPTAINDGFTQGITFPIAGFSGYQSASLIQTIGNPTLKPENTTSYEGGVDLVFLNNRIGLNFTYYNEKTTDQIFTVPIAYSTGYAAAILNAGSIRNEGYEVTLNLTPVKTKSVQWDLSFNWSKNDSKVLSLYPGIDNLFISGFINGGIYAVTGQPFGIIYGNTYVQDANGNTVINDDPNDPGYLKPIGGSTNQPLGNINPDWYGSAISTLTVHGFSLGFQIDVREGGDIWDGTRGALTYFGTSDATNERGQSKIFTGVLGHVDAAGNVVHFASDGSEQPGPGGHNSTASVLDQYYYQNIGSSFVGPASPSVEDGSFVRFREMSLSYDLPKQSLSKIGLYSCQITLFATNPVLWTKYKGVDPETSLIGPANGQGLDYFNNPNIKSYGIKLAIGL